MIIGHKCRNKKQNNSAVRIRLRALFSMFFMFLQSNNLELPSFFFPSKHHLWFGGLFYLCGWDHFVRKLFRNGDISPVAILISHFLFLLRDKQETRGSYLRKIATLVNHRSFSLLPLFFYFLIHYQKLLIIKFLLIIKLKEIIIS